MKISEILKRLRVIINNINIQNMTNLQETSVKKLDIKKNYVLISSLLNYIMSQLNVNVIET